MALAHFATFFAPPEGDIFRRFVTGLASGCFFQFNQTTLLANVIFNIGILDWLITLPAVCCFWLYIGEISVGLLSHSSRTRMQATEFVFLLEFAVLKVTVFQLEVAKLAVFLYPLPIVYSAELTFVLHYPYRFFVILHPFVCIQKVLIAEKGEALRTLRLLLFGKIFFRDRVWFCSFYFLYRFLLLL